MEAAKFTGVALSELQVRPVERREEARYQAQMARHHYLGELPKIGETVWYVAIWREQWVAQLDLSAAALKCGVRDRWIGRAKRCRSFAYLRIGLNVVGILRNGCGMSPRQ